jgi:hypothetical protein
MHVCMNDGTVGSNGASFGSMVDALPAVGVCVWSPVHRDWVEVSVRGNVYRPRESNNDTVERSLSFRTNELVSGSIIDVSGAYLLFQGAQQINSQRTSSVSPANILRDINKKRPHCPVLFSSIEAQYLSDRDRLVDSYSKKFALNPSGQSGAPSLVGSNGTVSSYRGNDGNGDSATAPPFVFTACGHVHAYSKEFIGR